VTRPRLLDLFGGCGGAARGYMRAGFDVTSIDIRRAEHWGDLRVMDWEAALDEFDLSCFAAIHASPPCQGYTAMNHTAKDEYPLLIPQVRERLKATGLPYVIENVAGAPIRRDLMLCGEQFGLRVLKHRYFELGRWSSPYLRHERHRGRVSGWRHKEWIDGPYFQVHGDGGSRGTVEQWQHAMGITWTRSRHELSEAIPPAYTEWIGGHLMSFVPRYSHGPTTQGAGTAQRHGEVSHDAVRP
jgi:DNA (cytosine-5)-methyltransferase 1